MSLYKYSFWEVLKHSFSAEVWDKVMPAIGETMYMVAVSSVSGTYSGDDEQGGTGSLQSDT